MIINIDAIGRNASSRIYAMLQPKYESSHEMYHPYTRSIVWREAGIIPIVIYR